MLISNIENILILACIHSLTLFILYKENLIYEYFGKHQNHSIATYLASLSKYKFLKNLLTCPLCLGVWLTFIIAPNLELYPTTYIIGQLLYKHIDD